MDYYDNSLHRDLERLMRRIPNFAPRGYGIKVAKYSAQDCDCKSCTYYKGRGKSIECGLGVCACIKERIEAGVASRREILTETMAKIRFPPFQKRLQKYLTELEGTSMDFKDEKHRTAFAEAIQRLDQKNDSLMAAVYLLTAEHRLWTASQHHIERNVIHFCSIKLKNSTVDGYALFCCAKDLCLGTKTLTVSDLGDTELIPPKLFGLICNAMAIRRFGLGAIQFTTEKTR